ncbi:Phosphocarrier protein HPr [Haladaptatus paucihalophilus DX253]|uniref:Phosphocarrier protein HPr n=2 Tax=Haladaptatus paucihalophilus DX253 TaxID=797209 RepID=A0A1M6Z0P0_HALPU|nr:phosphotransferase [Haladaptatus sp. T7]SHL23950.1 Phosphocarrier protein HPr [Haladaptatus paucihalophilus DX253]
MKRVPLQLSAMSRMERTVTIVPEAGLHARPAARFVTTANEFDADCTVSLVDGDPVDARSMLSVTTLNARKDDDVHLVAEGDDAEEALDALADVLTTPEDEES